MKNLNKFAAALSLTAGLFSASALIAQEEGEATTETVATQESDVANFASFGDWLVRCEAITVSRNACRLVQELTLQESGQLVSRFIVLPAPEGGAVLLAQVPMGVYLPGGAVVREAGRDDVEQREMIWQRCLGDLCEAALPLSQEDVAAWADTEALLFGYRMDPAAEPVIVSMDITELPEAIEAIAQ